MNAFKLRATVAAVALTVAAAWPAAAQELVLGYITAKAGTFVSLAKTNEIAAQIAVDEINAAGGVNGKQLRLEKFDSAGDPKQAVVGVRTLARDTAALAIIGPFSSSEARVVFPQGEMQKIVTMSMASSAPGLAEKFQFAFRNTSNEGYMFAQVMKTLRAQGIPAANAAIVYVTNDTVSQILGTRIFPAIFERAGIPVDATVSMQLKAFDLSPQVSQLTAAPTRCGRGRRAAGTGD